MHLFIFVTFLSLLTLTFSNPIIPTQPLASSPLSTHTGSSASKPTPWSFQLSYTPYPHPYLTTILSKTYSVHHYTESGHHTESRYDTESRHHTESHTHTESGTHTGPTGTYQYSVIAKPSATPFVYARDDAALEDPDCHPMCFPHGCICAGLKRDAAALSDNELAAALNARDELAAALQVRDGTATDGQCNWACFGTACECFNIAGKSVAVSKALAALAIFAAAAAVGIV